MPEGDDRVHRQRLRKEYKRRLYALELRQARQGDDTDPAVVTEIEDLRAKLADLQLAELTPPAPEVKEAVRRRFDDDLDFLIASFRSVNERQTRTEEEVTAIKAELREESKTSAQWREGHAQAHADGEASRVWGQRRNFWLLLVVLATAIIRPDTALWERQMGAWGIIIIIAVVAALSAVGILAWVFDPRRRKGD